MVLIISGTFVGKNESKQAESSAYRRVRSFTVTSANSNTLILVDQILHDLAEGLSDYEAIVESTVRRARPVVLTAIAAILAFFPLTLSSFWGALAFVLIGGVGVGTVLTLLFYLPYTPYGLRLNDRLKVMVRSLATETTNDFGKVYQSIGLPSGPRGISGPKV